MKLMRFIAIGLTLGILGFGLAAPTLAAAAEHPVVTIQGKASPIQPDIGRNLTQVEIKDDVGEGDEDEDGDERHREGRDEHGHEGHDEDGHEGHDEGRD